MSNRCTHRQRAVSHPGVGIALLLGITFATLFCTDDYNPFADISNARACIIGRSFRQADEGDSVAVFTRESLTVVVALREEVDSFSLAVPGNRLGAVTTKRNTDPDWRSSSPFVVTFSLTDTGTIALTLTSYRSNGDAVEEALTVRAFSPLAPQPVVAYLGQQTTLRTDSVGDRDVLYHWHFTDANVLSVSGPVADTSLSQIISGSGTGAMWVSDMRQEYESPAVPFSFILDDTVGPVISLTSSNSDTIITGDSIFTLEVSALDQGAGIVDMPTLNGFPMDRAGGDAYRATLRGLDSLRASQALPLTVVGTDRFGNQTARTFLLFFDPSVVQQGTLTLMVFSPQNDTSLSPLPEILILGKVEDYASDTLAVALSVTCNGVLSGDTTVSGRIPSLLWHQLVELGNTINTVTVTAQDLLHGAVRQQTLVVFHDSSFQDTKPPVIADVSVDGEPADRLFTSQDSVTLRIIAFDEASGIDTLNVGTSVVHPVDNIRVYLWHAGVRLLHVPGGNLVTIRAVDHAANKAYRTVLMFYNRELEISEGLEPETPLRVGQLYRDTLHVTDEDNDAITMVVQEAPPEMSVSGLAVSWVPGPGDIGSHTVRMLLDDDYQSMEYSCVLTVLPAENFPCTLSVVSAHGGLSGDTLLLPDTSGADTLRFSIHDPDYASSDRYTARITHGNTVINKSLDTARTFEMIVDPLAITSPAETLTVTIEDLAHNRDTLQLVLVCLRSTQPIHGRLVIDGSVLSGLITSDISGFPLLVRLTEPTFDFSRCPGDGSGIVFSKADGTELPYEVERWDSAGGSADLWVLVDTIHASPDSQWIGMSLDTSASSSPSSAIFGSSNGYAGVWHLDGMTESSSGGNHGTDYGTEDTAGAIGRARWFNMDDSDYVEIPNESYFDITGTITLSAWIKVGRFGNFPDATWQTIVAKYDDTYRLHRVQATNSVAFHINYNQDVSRLVETDGTMDVNDGAYHYVTGVVGADSMVTLYVDGVVDSVSNRQRLVTTTNNRPVRIGDNPFETDRHWDGVIDEVRIVRTPRTADWIRLCYETQKPGSALVRFENLP